MKKKWNNLYNDYINDEYKSFEEYYKIKIKLKKKFSNELLKKYNISHKPILECGCGTGKFSVYLSSLGIKTYAMDLEKEMVDRTLELSKKVVPKNKVNVLQGDIFKIPFKDNYFSITHSSGVLEHYSDNDIVKIINEQLRVSDYMIFSVPTKYFEKKMLGNERFLSRKKWRDIISKSNGKIIKESGYHYKTLKGRIIDIIKKPRYLFKPIALYVFVLERK